MQIILDNDCPADTVTQALVKGWWLQVVEVPGGPKGVVHGPPCVRRVTHALQHDQNVFGTPRRMTAAGARLRIARQ